MNEHELHERLSRPTPAAVDALRRCPGDVIVLGAGGKMGPSLATMLRRAADEVATRDGPPGARRRRVLAVSRWSSAAAAAHLEAEGVEVVAADLADRDAVDHLPDAPNVIFMAGQKFGTQGAPSATWAMNVVVPAYCADRYRDSRIVAFSTGNVYPLLPAAGGGARETDAPAPVGEYAASCLGRERVFEHWSNTRGTRVAIVRLNYAVDLRYGVLVDVALKVWRGEPVDVTNGYVNVIWQGDANALAIACLPHAATPPFVVNVTGPELLRVRDVARELGRLLGRAPTIVGDEAPDALLSRTDRMRDTLGPASVPAATLLEWVAEWVRAGNPLLGKPTKFERRDGKF
ncbi:MAG: NAD-dependent epimerase/dehydratase family protein [Gemmatimonadaceae bacterium]